MGIVRRRFIESPRSSSPALAPGELVWANIINGVENPAATGKLRPVILIESSGSQWQTMGLTTNSRYRDGSPRVPIPNYRAVGLSGPGWLWGDRLCRISAIDVDDHIGWVDEHLALEVIQLAGLTGPAARRVLDAARDHHSSATVGTRPRVSGGAR